MPVDAMREMLFWNFRPYELARASTSARCRDETGTALGSFSDAKPTAGRRSGDDFSVDGRDVGAHDRPAVAALGLVGGLLAAAVPLARIGGGLDQCGC